MITTATMATTITMQTSQNKSLETTITITTTTTNQTIMDFLKRNKILFFVYDKIVEYFANWKNFRNRKKNPEDLLHFDLFVKKMFSKPQIQARHREFDVEFNGNGHISKFARIRPKNAKNFSAKISLHHAWTPLEQTMDKKSPKIANYWPKPQSLRSNPSRRIFECPSLKDTNVTFPNLNVAFIVFWNFFTFFGSRTPWLRSDMPRRSN